MPAETDSEIIFRYTDPPTGTECLLLATDLSGTKTVGELVFDPSFSIKELRSHSEYIALRNTITGHSESAAVIAIGLPSSSGNSEVLERFMTQIQAFIDSGLKVRVGTPVHALLNDRRFLPYDSAPIFDIINAWSISESARHYYNFWGGSTNMKRFVVAGWNKTEQLASYYLSKHGGILVGFECENKFFYNQQGWAIDELEALLANENLKTEFEVDESEFLSKLEIQGAEILISSEVSVGQSFENVLNKQGFELLLCSEDHNMNHLHLEKWLQSADQKSSVIPNYICLSGQSRIWQLTESKIEYADAREYLMDVSKLIEAALMKIHQFNMKETGLYSKSLELAKKMRAGA